MHYKYDILFFLLQLRGGRFTGGIREYRWKEGQNRFVLRRYTTAAYHEQRSAAFLGVSGTNVISPFERL